MSVAITPEMVTSVAYLVAQFASAGISISQILQETKDTGIVPPEQWAGIMDEIRNAEALWESAPGPASE